MLNTEIEGFKRLRLHNRFEKIDIELIKLIQHDYAIEALNARAENFSSKMELEELDQKFQNYVPMC